MNQPITQVTVEVLINYSEQDASQIGRVLTHLSDRFDGSPVQEELLASILTSPFHDQLVARDGNGTIIGVATLSVTFGSGRGRSGWLEDFAVSPETQGVGVGSALWNAAIEWCKNKDAKKLNFTSRPSRTAAQQFYLKRGAVVRETNYFTKDTSKTA